MCVRFFVFRTVFQCMSDDSHLSFLMCDNIIFYFTGKAEFEFPGPCRLANLILESRYVQNCTFVIIK